MTKTLEQIQAENRKFILEAIHGCGYEEALQKELGFGCKILVKGEYRTFNNENGKYECGEGLITMDADISDYGADIDLEKNTIYTAKFAHEKIIEIIGRPITLNRVLNAIDHCGYYGCIAGHICKVNRKQATYVFICEWNLELETLEQQSEETQRVINQLLTGK